MKKLYAVKPESFIILKDGYTVDYTSLPDTIISSDRIKVNVEGDLNGIVFNNQKLSNFIASGKIEGFDGLETEFIPSDNLITTFTAKENTSLWKNETLKLVLNGGATIKWFYDSEALKKDFAGKNESDLKNMIIKYKDSLASMKIIFTPVWTRYVPDELNKIKINEEMPPLD